MTDPILSGYFANVGSDLTGGVLKVLGRKAQEFAFGTPRYQALKRCYGAAEAALLPPGDPLYETYRPMLQEFLADPVVTAELAKLIKGRQPDRSTLLDRFEEATYGRDLPAFDIATRLEAAIEAFLQVAEQEPALAGTIQTAQLRDLTAAVHALPAEMRAVVRDVVEAVRATAGGVTAGGDIQAQNIVTGTQINHIVNVYRTGGGAWVEADYRAALERYLEWLSAAMGRVVLSGIKRGGQQAVELSLQEVYVPLAAEALPEARAELKAGLARSTELAAESMVAPAAKRITMAELLAQGRCLAVIGSPGCGKTTVLQHLAWTLAEALRTNRPDLAADQLGLTGELPLPVYVPLSLYADYRHIFARDRDPRQRQLATFINHYLLERQAGLNLPDDFFASLLNQGRHILVLLDGLDEVATEEERVLVSQAVRDLTYGRPQARFVVTSRTRAYQGRAVLSRDFRVVQVLPLEPAQVADLIRQAYQAIYPAEVERDERERRANNLIDSVERLEAERAAHLGAAEENRLVTTPLLVRMLLIVHFNLRRLPDQRAELYIEVVDTLLTSAYNPDEAVAQRLAQLGGDWRSRREMFQELAFQMHSRGQEAGREIDERELADLLQNYLVERRHKSMEVASELVTDFIAASRQRGSLLEEQAGRHRFAHLSFQEFLAARYLAEVVRDVGRMVQFIADNGYAAAAWWREPILLTTGYLNVTAPHTATDLIQRLAGLEVELPVRPATALDLAAAELAATAFLEWGGAEATRQTLAARLVELLTDPALPGATPPLRAAAGRALARLGDSRPGVGVITVGANGHPPLPDLTWCEVPAGPFLLGANVEEDAWADEKPQHKLTLPTFYIARYPITNAQFAPFVEAGGYEEPRWWTEAGWAWRNGADPDLSQIPDKDLRQQYVDWLTQRPVERRRVPYFWREETWNLPNHPVVGVSWYEAMAYCAWLNERIRAAASQRIAHAEQPSAAGLPSPVAGLPDEAIAGLAQGIWQLRLPGEAEWEKAAGWDPPAKRKRVYAWGDDWDETKANIAEKIGRTSAVGIFPVGAAACGALDMTGNVWEWTLSSWGSFDYQNPGFKYPFQEASPQTGSSQRENVNTPGFRAVRGGSWNLILRTARVSSRYLGPPDNFYDNVGFRVSVAPVLS